MNPFGIIILGLGIILFVIGFQGSQHSVWAALKGTASEGKI